MESEGGGGGGGEGEGGGGEGGIINVQESLGEPPQRGTPI